MTDLIRKDRRTPRSQDGAQQGFVHSFVIGSAGRNAPGFDRAQAGAATSLSLVHRQVTTAKPGGSGHDIEQQTFRKQARPPVRRHPLVPARADRNRPSTRSTPTSRSTGVPFDEGSPFLAGSRMGPRSIPRALAALRRPRCRVLRPGNRTHLPGARDGEQDHRRCRRRRRLAHRRAKHLRQRDRPDQGGPRQRRAAGDARRRPLGDLPGRQGVRGRGAAARHPLRRPYRLRAVHPRSPFHQRPPVSPYRSDAARAEPRPDRHPQPAQRPIGNPRLDRRRQPGDDHGRVPQARSEGRRRNGPARCADPM